MREALKLIRASANRGSTIADLKRAAGVSRATVFRLLAACQQELGVRIVCEDGIFRVCDWGILNKRKVLQRQITAVTRLNRVVS